MTYMYDVYQCPGAVWGFGVGNRVGAMGKPLARRCFLGVWRWESRWREGASWVYGVGNRVGAMAVVSTISVPVLSGGHASWFLGLGIALAQWASRWREGASWVYGVGNRVGAMTVLAI